MTAMGAAHAAVAALQFHGPGDMMGGAGWMLWGAWLFGVLFWVTLFVLIIVVIWKLVKGTADDTTVTRELDPSAGSPGGGESALAILERRYASGEIDREEFVQKREDLRHGR